MGSYALIVLYFVGIGCGVLSIVGHLALFSTGIKVYCEKKERKRNRLNHEKF